MFTNGSTAIDLSDTSVDGPGSPPGGWSNAAADDGDSLARSESQKIPPPSRNSRVMMVSSAALTRCRADGTGAGRTGRARAEPGEVRTPRGWTPVGDSSATGLLQPVVRPAGVGHERKQPSRLRQGGIVGLEESRAPLDRHAWPPGATTQAIGIKILVRSIEEPLRQIVANAGEDAVVGLCPPANQSPQGVREQHAQRGHALRRARRVAGNRGGARGAEARRGARARHRTGGGHGCPVSCHPISVTGMSPAPFNSSKKRRSVNASPSWCERSFSSSSMRYLPVT